MGWLGKAWRVMQTHITRHVFPSQISTPAKNAQPIAGEAISLPPGWPTACSDEWYHAGRGTDSPDILQPAGLHRAGG